MLKVLLALTLLLTAGGETADGAQQAGKLNNVIRWATASEIDNFGYHVYRALDEEGPFERLTDDPITGAGTTDVTQLYEYVDDSIEPDTSYYYYVESISMDGERERFTPVYASRPKRLGD